MRESERGGMGRGERGERREREIDEGRRRGRERDIEERETCATSIIVPLKTYGRKRQYLV